MKIKEITLHEVQYIAHRLARELMQGDEPIPSFDTRYPRILESCLATPFQRFSRRNLYKGLAQKSAILFYLMIKNHPLENGNKRVAVTTLLVFLLKNGKWLKVDNQQLYNFAVWIAQSDARFKNKIVDIVEEFIKNHLVLRNES